MKLKIIIPLLFSILILTTQNCFAQKNKNDTIKIKKLIKQLGNDFFSNRLKAKKELRKYGKKAVPLLKNALSNKNLNVRRLCAELLGESGSRESVNNLIPLLIDEEVSVRQSAVRALISLRIYSRKRMKDTLNFGNKREKECAKEVLRELMFIDTEKILASKISKGGISGSYNLQFEEFKRMKKEVYEILLEIGLNEFYRFRTKIKRRNYEDIKSMAINALGDLKVKKAMAKFIAKYGEKDTTEYLKLSLAASLKKIGYDNAFNECESKYKSEARWGGSRKSLYACYSLSFLYLRVQKYNKALVYLQMIKNYLPQRNGPYYNLACVYSKLKRKREALEALRKAVELGFCDLDWLNKDKDLDNIRNEPEFKKIMKKIENNYKKIIKPE